MKPMPPCLGCPIRSSTCHTTCDRYKKYREAIEKFNNRAYPYDSAAVYTLDTVHKHQRRQFLQYTKRSKKHYR